MRWLLNGMSGGGNATAKNDTSQKKAPRSQELKHPSGSAGDSVPTNALSASNGMLDTWLRALRQLSTAGVKAADAEASIRQNMKLLIAVAILILAGGLTAHAQTGETVTISKEAAIKCLQDSDKAKALEAEMKVKDQAIEDYKKLVTDLKIELAKVTGEKTGSDQMVVRLTAILDIVIPKVRKKSIGLIAF